MTAMWSCFTTCKSGTVTSHRWKQMRRPGWRHCCARSCHPRLQLPWNELWHARRRRRRYPTVGLKNDPPRIFVSYKPAILLDMDGEPVHVPIPETNLEYVMNTSWRVIRDKADSSYYFLAGEQWLTAAKLDGTWSAANRLPREMDAVAKDGHFADLKDFVPLRPAKADAVVPVVYYTTVPAQAILFEGQPAYAPI